MDDPHLACITCREQVDALGPGVCQFRDPKGDIKWGWVAFVEDWRGGSVDLIHPICFAHSHGVGELIRIVHERDVIERGAVPRLMTKVADLRRRLGDSK